VLALTLPSLVSIDGALVHPARVAAFVTVLSLAIELPLGSFSSLLKGHQRFDVVNAGSILSLAVYAALIVLLLDHEGSVAELAGIAFAATMIRVLIPALAVKREIPELRVSLHLVSRARLRELTSFSGYAVIGQIAGKIIFSADAILIGLFLGPAGVAVYGVGSRLFAVASGLATAGSDLVFPLYSELHGSGETDRQRSYLLTALRASMCVVVLVTGPLLAVPGWVIRAWLPDGFEASRAPLVLLAATLFFAHPTGVLGQYLLGRGRPRPLALVQISFGIANLVLTSLLLAGAGVVWVAALSTLVLEGVVGVVAVPRLVTREGVAYRALVRAWARPVAAGIPAAAVTLVPAAILWHASSSLAGILLLGAAWTAAYGAFAWRLALGTPERMLVRRLVGAGRLRAASARGRASLGDQLDPQHDPRVGQEP